MISYDLYHTVANIFYYSSTVPVLSSLAHWHCVKKNQTKKHNGSYMNCACTFVKKTESYIWTVSRFTPKKSLTRIWLKSVRIGILLSKVPSYVGVHIKLTKYMVVPGDPRRIFCVKTPKVDVSL